MEAAGTACTVFEFTLLPHMFVKSLYDMFAFLPYTLWDIGSKSVRGMLGRQEKAKAR